MSYGRFKHPLVEFRSIEYWRKKGRLETFQDLQTEPCLAKANKFQTKQPISLKLPPVRPKSVYLSVRRAPVSKFDCMSLRSAAFHINSGQLRFATIRNLTVIIRDSNFGAYQTCQIDKTSLSQGRVITCTLSQTDTIGGAGAFNSTGNSSRVISVSYTHLTLPTNREV